VLGQRFSLAALRHLVGDPHYSCNGLLAKYLLRPWGEHYLFTHALIAEGIYGSLPKLERKRLHRLAADWFGECDAPLAAEHLDRADDPRAAFAYLNAARVQASEYRNDDALRLARRARELARDAATQYEAACLEGEVAQELGAIDVSIAAYEHASQTAVSGGERLRAWVGIAAGLRVRDRYAEALDYLERAEHVATRAEDLALIHFHRGNIMVPLGRTGDCLRAHQLALEYAREARSPMLEARALSGLGDAHYLLGRMRTAHSHFARCIDLCRAHGFGRIEVANLAMRGATRFYAAEAAAAIEDSRAAADLAIHLGNRRAEAIARNVSAYLLYYAAEYEAARAEAEQGIALARTLGSHRFEVKSLLNLGMALFGLGETEAAEKALDEAYAIGERSRIDLWTAWVLGALALVTRNPERRRWALARGESLLAKGSVGHSYLHFYQFAIETALAESNWREAERYADLLAEYTRAEQLPWSDCYIARARTCARHGQGVTDSR
jgi:tetratricopeptide (TPR) repeat protein